MDPSELADRAALEAQLESFEAENAALKAETASLQAQHAALTAECAQLQTQSGSMSALPPASMADTLDWKALNAWYVLKQKRGEIPEQISEDFLRTGPKKGDMGPEVLPAGVSVLLQAGNGLMHGVGCTTTGTEGVSMRYSYRPHALQLQGPAKAGDVLKALSEQVTKEVLRNMLLRKLAATAMHNITFVEDSAGDVKDVKGKTFTRKLEKVERSDDNDEDEDDDEYWVSIGKTPSKKLEPLYKQLGMTAERLLANFGKLMYPENSERLNGGENHVLEVTEGRDPLAAMTLEELEQLVQKTFPYGGVGCGGSTALLQIVPAGHSKCPTGQLPGKAGEHVYCAVWSGFFC
ncbi:hypothetical protein FOA52_016097 [Chlamydomonas sp. UWO 241]|nr:hypothetical protein FOA52_016097 [Chlamydomonas sp. UWO 241]